MPPKLHDGRQSWPHPQLFVNFSPRSGGKIYLVKTLRSLDEMTFTNDSLVTITALAEHFGIRRGKLGYAIKRGHLRGWLFGGQWHVRWGDFKRWLVRGMLGRRIPAIECPVCGSVFRRGKYHVSVIKTGVVPEDVSVRGATGGSSEA